MESGLRLCKKKLVSEVRISVWTKVKKVKVKFTP